LDPIGAQAVTDITEDTGGLDLSDPFGIYRAEWLSDALFQLFTKPAYYPELETPRPCILVGGRGTGKTTVLKCLSYEGRYKLSQGDDNAVPTWPYYGFYHRVNTNRVTAFRGDELTQAQWTKSYAHYVNLVMCEQVTSFLNWYEIRTGRSINLPEEVCLDVSEALYIEPASSAEELAKSLKKGQRRFEAFLNNLDPSELPPLSLQGQPVDDLCSAALASSDFAGKSFFFIVDEFENLLDYQQEVLNTLIKHCGPYYTFKIGVRNLGWRRRSTLNSNEQLISPADYERIDIEQRLEGDQFSKFATEVCNLRAQAVPDFPSGIDMARILPPLPLDEEAELLGISAHAERILGSVARDCPEWITEAKSMPKLELYLVEFWARSQKLTLRDIFEERRQFPVSWSDRLGNYKAPLLFTLRGKRAGVKKYYAGWKTYTSMASCNIRYLLELVGQALLLQRQAGGQRGDPIPPDLQTRAAEIVGRKNLAELEGLSVHGAQLTKLLLGLGRIFEVLASQPEAHAPEVTQFSLPEDAPLGEAGQLLSAAVMHLVLVRSVANKRMDLDLKAYDYAVHPIFSAFFVFSHRRKRKLKLTPAQIVQLVREPRLAMRQILRQHGRTENDAPLPEQLKLFEGFYSVDQ